MSIEGETERLQAFNDSDPEEGRLGGRQAELRTWQRTKSDVLACLNRGQLTDRHWSLQPDGWVVFSGGRWRHKRFKVPKHVLQQLPIATPVDSAVDVPAIVDAVDKESTLSPASRTTDPADSVHFTAGFWFDLLGWPADVRLEADTLSWRTRQGAVSIPVTALDGVPSYTRNWLWDTITIYTAGQAHVIRGLLRISDPIRLHHFRQRCSAWFADTLRTFRDEFASKLSATYLRDSHLDALDASLQALLRRSRGFYAGLTDAARKDHDWLAALSPLPAHKGEIREAYIRQKHEEHARFFDLAESNPLSAEQTKAVILDDDRNLILAAAGTGKTSVIVAKTLYLMLEGRAKPEDILILAYSRKAREELQARMNQRLEVLQQVMPDRFPNNVQPQVSTFHALGLHILRQSGLTAKVSQFAEHPKTRARWVTEQLDDYLRGGAEPISQFLGAIYPVCDPFEFESQQDYARFLRDNVYETLNGDMVRSYQELLIGNWLYIQGVGHTYEPNYDRTAYATLGYLYRPDFHIDGTQIYLEHFGIDRQGNTRPDIDAQAYNEGIQKKREIHQSNGTVLLETFHYEWCEGQLYTSLERQLREAGVALRPRSWPEIHRRLNELQRVSQAAEVFDKAISAVRLERLSPVDITARFRQAKFANGDNFQRILVHLLHAYEAVLREAGEIDFEDMIGQAIDTVASKRFTPPWRYLLVDEFQDISQLRMDLLRAIQDNVKSPSLYCVGDDWQSIYRFSGGKLELTTRFETLVGSASTAAIQKTYRYNDSIAKVAGDFVMRNPEQYRKHITTAHTVHSPQVFIVDTRIAEGANDTDEGTKVRAIVETIRRHDPAGSIAVLGRYHHVLSNIRTAFEPLPDIGKGLIYWTFHGSKGLEADYCILAGFRQGRFGFPSENRTEAAVEALLPSLDGFAFSEERRLMYVALTRARKKVYIVADPLTPSRFVEELMASGDVDVRSERFQEAYRSAYKCPTCQDGYMVKRYNFDKAYYTCNAYPGCRTKAKACDSCGGVMVEADGVRMCRNPSCTSLEHLCPQCGRPLRLRHSRFGEFWGCSGFGAPGREQCTYKTNRPAPGQGSRVIRDHAR